MRRDVNKGITKVTGVMSTEKVSMVWRSHVHIVVSW